MLSCNGIVFDPVPTVKDCAVVQSGSFASRKLALRRWERDYVPMFSPQIALDILLYAAVAEASGNPASAKEFHLALGHSKDRTREVAQSLLASHWIQHTPDVRDARVRRVTLTEKGRQLIHEYQRECLARTGG